MVRYIVVAALSAVAATTVSAQTGPYRIASTDTLKYREISSGEVVIATPQGELMSRSEHDATLHVVSSGAGQARAWYVALHVRSVGPNGDQTPSTAPLLGQPYQLAYPADGRVTLVDAPDVPPDVAAITDLTHQFFDFFVSMPREEPSPGDSWQDTLRSTAAAPPTTSQLNEAVRTFRVRGDTVLAGRRAVLIDVTASFRAEARAPMDGQPLEVATTLVGSERGLVIFDWAAGRLLHRSKSGSFRGALRLTGGPQAVEFPQTYEYTSTIDLARSSP